MMWASLERQRKRKRVIQALCDCAFKNGSFNLSDIRLALSKESLPPKESELENMLIEEYQGYIQLSHNSGGGTVMPRAFAENARYQRRKEMAYQARLAAAGIILGVIVGFALGRWQQISDFLTNLLK